MAHAFYLVNKRQKSLEAILEGEEDRLTATTMCLDSEAPFADKNSVLGFHRCRFHCLDDCRK